MKALIDGDILVYSCGFASDKREKQPDGSYLVTPEPLEFNLHSVKQLINRIMTETRATDKQIYLTGEGNYREEFATIKPYKGNRDPALKPHWYKEIKEYLIKHQGAVIVEGREADDAMGCEQYADYMHGTSSLKTTICTLDKDLDMIPGIHYNWRKNIKYTTNLFTANHSFYKQLLIGDPTDNIQGVPKIGKKKAEKLLPDPTMSELDMYTIVKGAYQRAFTDGSHMMKMKENAILLWIQREEGVTWAPPTGADIS